MIEDSKVPDPTQELSYTVDFVTDPAGANVFFDGVYKGVTPHTLSGVTRGTHDVLYSCPGYTEVRQEILVTENTALRSTLTKEVFESHPVKIETLPDGAKIYINGQYRGVSPLQIHLMDGTL